MTIKTLARYQFDFGLAALANLIFYGTSLALLGILTHRFQGVSGWSVNEIGFLYSFGLLGFGIGNLFFQQLTGVDRLVLTGGLDRLLLRPRSVLFQLVFGGFNAVYLTHVLFAGAILAIASVGVDIESPIIAVGYGSAMLLCAVMIQFGLSLLIAASAFWILDSGSLVGMMIYAPRELSWYPIDIFSAPLRALIVYVLPFAFISYFPVRGILAKNDGIYPAYYSMLPVPVAVCLLSFAFFLWRRGLARYSSAGG